MEQLKEITQKAQIRLFIKKSKKKFLSMLY